MASNKLYVGNLNYQVTEDELREIFKAYGQVISVNLISGKGFGVVEMWMGNPVVHFEIIGKGGKTIVPVTEIPGMVTFAQFADPEGNVVGIVKNELPAQS